MAPRPAIRSCHQAAHLFALCPGRSNAAWSPNAAVWSRGSCRLGLLRCRHTVKCSIRTRTRDSGTRTAHRGPPLSLPAGRRAPTSHGEVLAEDQAQQRQRDRLGCHVLALGTAALCCAALQTTPPAFASQLTASVTTPPAAAPLEALTLGKSVIHHMVSGGLGGSIGAAAVYPLDVVKTRLQAQRRGTHLGDEHFSRQQRLYKGPVDCFFTMLREEGPGSMYSGLLAQLIGVWPDKAVKLSANEFMLKILWNPEAGVAPVSVQLFAGLFSGVFQVVFSNPREIVKIQMQMNGEHQREEMQGLQVSGRRVAAAFSVLPQEPRQSFALSQGRELVRTVKRLGVKGLYRGASVCAARDMTFGAVFFPTYAFLKEWSQHQGHDGLAYLALMGTLAGVPAAILTTPADVVKTRVQAPRSVDMDRTPWTHLREVLSDGGLPALFTGAGPRVLRAAPQFGVTLLVYETVNQHFGW